MFETSFTHLPHGCVAMIHSQVRSIDYQMTDPQARTHRAKEQVVRAVVEVVAVVIPWLPTIPMRIPDSTSRLEIRHLRVIPSLHFSLPLRCQTRPSCTTVQ